LEVKGIKFSTRKNKRELLLSIEPLLLETPINAKTIMQLVKHTPFNHYFLLENAIFEVCDKLSAHLSQNNMQGIEAVIGEAKDAEIEVTISADKMFAELTISAPYAGKIPNVSELVTILHDNAVLRGIGKKRIKNLIRQVSENEPGMRTTRIVAKGLPAKDGKNSFVVPSVPNVLERVLAPKATDDEKVDMRDFGELICVEKNQIVAKRIPPSKGRSGFSVTGEVIASAVGQWKKIKLGNNVYIPDSHENTVLAKLVGLAKFSNGIISVDDVLTTKGVNVATGNIKYGGAVIVNGDVTEKMRIVCEGDVTINGFVESAYIESGGDIIVTQGATGKMHEADCQLIAKGNVFLEHGQGLHITSGSNINVAKQLAYSNINCQGNLTVGQVSNPRGKLFASTIVSHGAVVAGYIGAVSGSELSIDFTPGYERLQSKLDGMVGLFKDLSTKNADHEIKISNINNRHDSAQQKEKKEELNKELELERIFLNWLRVNMDEIRWQTEHYQQKISVNAHCNLYPGVNIKLGKTSFKAVKEYSAGKVIFDENKWRYQFL